MNIHYNCRCHCEDAAKCINTPREICLSNLRLQNLWHRNHNVQDVLLNLLPDFGSQLSQSRFWTLNRPPMLYGVLELDSSLLSHTQIRIFFLHDL